MLNRDQKENIKNAGVVDVMHNGGSPLGQIELFGFEGHPLGDELTLQRF